MHELHWQVERLKKMDHEERIEMYGRRALELHDFPFLYGLHNSCMVAREEAPTFAPSLLEIAAWVLKNYPQGLRSIHHGDS